MTQITHSRYATYYEGPSPRLIREHRQYGHAVDDAISIMQDLDDEIPCYGVREYIDGAYRAFDCTYTRA